MKSQTSTSPFAAARGTADLPVWERALPAPLGSPRRADGWLDRLTWQSRRLELVADAAGRITGVVYCVGETLDGDGLLDGAAGDNDSQERVVRPHDRARGHHPSARPQVDGRIRAVSLERAQASGFQNRLDRGIVV